MSAHMAYPGTKHPRGVKSPVTEQSNTTGDITTAQNGFAISDCTPLKLYLQACVTESGPNIPRQIFPIGDGMAFVIGNYLVCMCS